MTSTLAALLLAHVVADFLLQTNSMAKQKRKPRILLLHGVIVLVTAQLALGRFDAWEIIVLAAGHIVIDIFKVYALPDRLVSFLTDQGLHIITILAVTFYAPTLYTDGYWADITWLPAVMILASGFIVTTKVGSHAVKLFFQNQKWSGKVITNDSLPKVDNKDNLPNAGSWIGLLERSLIFILIIAEQPAGIGLLIAAKSVLRFKADREQKDTEYVIIGTLASFVWAMVITWATILLLQTVHPLGIELGLP